jgi:hypothetical protein
MTDLPLAPKKANERLRPVEGNKPKNLSEKEREDLFERYSLDELIRHFGRWPTYYLILRKFGSQKQGRLLIGLSVVIASVAIAYFRH